MATVRATKTVLREKNPSEERHHCCLDHAVDAGANLLGVRLWL